MPYIKNRRVVNVCIKTPTSMSQDVPLNFTFTPNKVIVRSFCYDASDNIVTQVGTNLVREGVLFSFNADQNSQSLDIHFDLINFNQTNNWNFQLQTPPLGTGNGQQSNNLTGNLSFMLEFQEEEKPKHKK